MTSTAIPEKPVAWLGHYSVLLLWVAVAAGVANNTTGLRIAAVSTMASVAWIAWIVAWAADYGYHQSHLCERCVAASPLNPQAVAARRKGILRAHHARKAQLAVLAFVVAWMVADPLMRHPAAWTYVLNALVLVALGVNGAVTWQHRRLYPWCPFCRWGDGGSHEVSPDIPAPAASC